jgi:hypothetical protein
VRPVLHPVLLLDPGRSLLNCFDCAPSSTDRPPAHAHHLPYRACTASFMPLRIIALMLQSCRSRCRSVSLGDPICTSLRRNRGGGTKCAYTQDLISKKTNTRVPDDTRLRARVAARVDCGTGPRVPRWPRADRASDPLGRRDRREICTRSADPLRTSSCRDYAQQLCGVACRAPHHTLTRPPLSLIAAPRRTPVPHLAPRSSDPPSALGPLVASHDRER